MLCTTLYDYTYDLVVVRKTGATAIDQRPPDFVLYCVVYGREFDTLRKLLCECI